MSSAWHETFAERLNDDYAAAAQPRRITGRELVEHITARPAWLDLPVHLLAMTDDAEWLNEIDRDCYEPDEGDVLALLAHEDGCPRAANPKARCGCVLAAKATRLLRAERDAAKTRAEKAEAAVATLHAVIENMHKHNREQREGRRQAETALARLRAQLGESGIEWGVQHPLYGTEYIQGADNARMECDKLNADETGQPWRVVTRLAGQWRGEDEPDATRLERYDDATPRTALERAAGEQAVRCGTECSEGHTYEPGSCEAAIDPDEAIARNHADAKRDWGIDEQGEREGGSA